MAEATLTPTEETPLNDEVLETPNPAPEAAPPAEDNEDAFESPFSDDDILKEAGLVSDADGAGNGAGAAPDGRMPSEYEGKSAEEIEQIVEAKAAAKANAQVSNQQTQQYYAGVRSYLENVVKEIDKRADANGGYVDREWAKETFNTVKGDIDILRNYDVNQAAQQSAAQAAANERRTMGQAAVTILGQKLANELFKTQINDPKLFLEGVAEHFAKAKGYVPAEKVKEAAIKGHRIAEDKYKKILKEHGIEVASTGQQVSGATAGTGGKMTLARFEALSLDDQAKVSAADRARIYGSVR